MKGTPIGALKGTDGLATLTSSPKTSKVKRTKNTTSSGKKSSKKVLVIVESPAKAKTIERHLGKNYIVRASMGHLRDLPKSQFGIDVENEFSPKYINVRGKGELIRALIISNLTAIYIKQHLGTLSALCGCVVASTGSSCGITYLMGGTFEQICYSVKNMIANLTGMICDGAKPSCALKLSSGVSTAVLSAMLAIQHKYVTSVEGIIDDDVDRSIRNLAAIGSQGMDETDRYVLDIMTHKSC